MLPNAVPIVEACALSDEVIASRVRAGETALFEIILRRHDQQLFRAARAILGDDAEAEDALQQAWLLAYSKLGQFTFGSKLATWLTRIVINEALQRRPRLRLEDAEMASVEDRASLASSPEDQASLGEMARMLEKAVDQLSEPYRVVFILREAQGLSTADAAACLGVSEDVIKVRLHRAKARLQEIVASRLEAAAPTVWQFLGARCDRMVAKVMAAIASR